MAHCANDCGAMARNGVTGSGNVRTTCCDQCATGQPSHASNCVGYPIQCVDRDMCVWLGCTLGHSRQWMGWRDTALQCHPMANQLGAWQLASQLGAWQLASQLDARQLASQLDARQLDKTNRAKQHGAPRLIPPRMAGFL